ncbi:MFS transporter [Sporobolomyces koalae]|uniref:MFS transporter n=1 Tax=Sporobolomyces koalae TaxID=500713 RepID=UPI00316DE69F
MTMAVFVLQLDESAPRFCGLCRTPPKLNIGRIHRARKTPRQKNGDRNLRNPLQSRSQQSHRGPCARMELPIAPRPAYFVNPVTGDETRNSTPSSPLSTAPPSPTAATRGAFEYPPSSIAPSSAPASRSSSKNPLFKKDIEDDRRRRNNRRPNGWTWLSNLLPDNKHSLGHELELEESRGRRRRSVSHAEEAAQDDHLSERRQAQAIVRNELDKRTSRGSNLSSIGSGSKAKTFWSKENAQLAVAFAMIGLVGMNDSATGANLESMQEHYGVSYDEISLVFLSNVAGYLISSISASFLTHHIGVNYTLLVAAAAMSLGCVALSLAPPFPAFIIALAFLGFGAGIYDAAITTVVSHFESQAMMSCMYAFFGIGAFFSPIIIGSFVDKGIDWSRYYFAPLAISLALAVLGFFAFRDYAEPADESHDVPATLGGDATEGEVIHARATMSAQQRMKRALKIPAVWLGFLLIMIAFASSDTLSAWIVSFMVQKRGSPEAASRYQLAGLWGGIALGRIVLAVALGSRLGERSFAIVMLACACVFLSIIWAVKQYVVDAVAMVLVGFFFGPVTPRVLSVVGKRVPPSLKSSVMSLTIGLGLIGSACGPLFFGFVAGRGGLGALPGTLIVMSLVSASAWCLMPKNRRRED